MAGQKGRSGGARPNKKPVRAIKLAQKLGFSEEEIEGVEKLNLQPETVQMFAAMKRGLSAKEALQTVKGNLNPATSTQCMLRKRFESWSIHSPAKQKIAHRTITKFAQGKKVGTVEPNSSSVLTAAMRILDAEDPVIKKTQSLNVNLDLSPVDLTPYMNPDRKAIDVTPEDE